MVNLVSWFFLLFMWKRETTVLTNYDGSTATVITWSRPWERGKHIRAIEALIKSKSGFDKYHSFWY
jgi:hypothetical protein